MAKEAWKLFGHRKVDRIHVWQRDVAEPGDHGYEPGITAEAIEVHAKLLEQCPRLNLLATKNSRSVQSGPSRGIYF